LVISLKKILIADDNKDLLELVLTTLTESGYKTMVAPNGQIAFNVAKKKKPDLIILDWMMPELNGIETIKLLKIHPKTENIPVIMLTSQIQPRHLEEGLDAGAVDYIKKPFHKLELLARIKSNLRLIEQLNEIHQLELEKAQKTAELEKIKNEKLENEIKVKSKTLQVTGIYISQKNHIIDKSLSGINRIISSDDDRKNKKLFQELIEFLESSRDSDYTLKYFEKDLHSINQNLLDKITKENVNLSKIELKVCSMIGLGLTNKQIAQILFVSIRTVESHRYNASKKLNLPKDTTLQQHINQII
jgi:DNA-binding response OmpR family regulator/DNA-binding CsgD family transcriptional regulator